MRILAPLLCLAVLTGCTSDLTTLRDLKPAADDFAGALAAEYRDFAGSEAEQGRSSAADHFAVKGLRAYHGVDVAPDVLDASIGSAQAAELAEARGQLVRLLTPEVKEAAPQELARMQLLFDCWQQQLVAGMPTEKALCKSEFAPALSGVLKKAGPEIYGKAFRRSIPFAPNVTKLTEENKADISDVLCQLSDMQGSDYWVELQAYVGKKTSQRKLTEARIANVKKFLVSGGVPTRQIRIQREGAKSVVLSRDNIPMNTKVVTITIAAEPYSRAKGSK